MWGRILCISYAMIGIPLMLMYLTNIGDLLADVFRYVYAKIICCGCMKARRKPREFDAKKVEHAGCDEPEPIEQSQPYQEKSSKYSETMTCFVRHNYIF